VQHVGWNRCALACMMMLVCALTASPGVAQFARPLEGRVDPFARSRTRGLAYTNSNARDREFSTIADYDPSIRTASFDQTTAMGSSVAPAAYVQGWPSNRRIMPAPEDTWSFQWLPDSLIYKSYLAGVKEPRLSGTIGTGRSNIVGNDWLLEGNLGARVGIFRYGTQQAMLAQGFQMDVEGAAQLRLDLSDDVDVVATDYRAGVPLSYGWGNHQFKLAYYHVSSHLGDEYLIKRPDFPRLNFVRDVFVFGWSYYLNLDLRFYAEAGWAFKTDISQPWEFQFGIDWAPGCPTGIRGAPFFAINAHVREELSFGGNITTQAGWAWRADRGGRLFRAGLQYYNGASNQYSFYQYHENELSFGLWYDF
jgi:hypothetical protein